MASLCEGTGCILGEPLGMCVGVCIKPSVAHVYTCTGGSVSSVSLEIYVGVTPCMCALGTKCAPSCIHGSLGGASMWHICERVCADLG